MISNSVYIARNIDEKIFIFFVSSCKYHNAKANNITDVARRTVVIAKNTFGNCVALFFFTCFHTIMEPIVNNT